MEYAARLRANSLCACSHCSEPGGNILKKCSASDASWGRQRLMPWTDTAFGRTSIIAAQLPVGRTCTNHHVLELFRLISDFKEGQGPQSFFTHALAASAVVPCTSGATMVGLLLRTQAETIESAAKQKALDDSHLQSWVWRLCISNLAPCKPSARCSQGAHELTHVTLSVMLQAWIVWSTKS